MDNTVEEQPTGQLHVPKSGNEYIEAGFLEHSLGAEFEVDRHTVARSPDVSFISLWITCDVVHDDQMLVRTGRFPILW